MQFPARKAARRFATGLFPRGGAQITESEYADDLRLLRELDHAGRVPGQPVDTLDDVLDYLKGLEHESYLDE